MNPRILSATTVRIMQQLKRDPRTITLILVMPSLMLLLLYFIFEDNDVLFNSIAPIMIAIFPMFILLVVASVAMQRERASGKLERLLTTRMHQADLVLGYAITLSFLAVLQSLLLFSLSTYVLEIPSEAPGWVMILVSIFTGIVGISLGLMGSTIARSEFQAVQLIPVFMTPQIFLCGLLIERDRMPSVLETISDFLPLSYAVDAITEASSNGLSNDVWLNLSICCAFGLVFLGLSALTMPRVSK